MDKKKSNADNQLHQALSSTMTQWTTGDLANQTATNTYRLYGSR